MSERGDRRKLRRERYHAWLRRRWQERAAQAAAAQAAAARAKRAAGERKTEVAQ